MSIPNVLPLASYILRRLHQNGVSHLHGVPGDFTLPFLSHIKTSPVKWIGNCNELNAGYAADGYARINGLGALCTTFGVGELSAINSIAGAYAESVPIINIVGTPSRKAQREWESKRGTKSRGLMHHMLGYDSDMSWYQQMYVDVTCEQISLDDEKTAPELFEQAIKRSLHLKKPAYVGIPSDMADVLVHGRPDDGPAYEFSDQPRGVLTAIARAVKALTEAERPLILVDGVSERFGLRMKINNLVEMTGVPTVCLPHGLGIVDSHHPNYHGVYTGNLASPELKAYVDSSDFIMAICRCSAIRVQRDGQLYPTKGKRCISQA